MRAGVLFSILFVVLAGCQPSSPKTPGTPQSGAVAGAAQETEAAVKPKSKGAGDAESEISVESLVVEDPSRPNVVVNAQKNAKKILSMCEVNVAPPLPTELKVNVKIKVQSDYSAQPVLLRGVIRRDGQVIDAIHTVVAGHKPLEVAGAAWPNEFNFDVLKGVTSLPASILVDVMLTAEVMPVGTDPGLLDPGKAPAPDALIGNLMSNPLRINFASAGGTP